MFFFKALKIVFLSYLACYLVNLVVLGAGYYYHYYSENVISLSPRCSARTKNKHGKKSETEISGGFGEFDEISTHSVRCSSPRRMGGQNPSSSGQQTTMDTICSSRNVNYKLSGSSKLVTSSIMQSEGGGRDLLTPGDGTTKHFRARSPSPFEKHHHLNIDGLRISHLHNNNSEAELAGGSGSTPSIPTKCSSQLAKVLEKQIEVK